MFYPWILQYDYGVQSRGLNVIDQDGLKSHFKGSAKRLFFFIMITF